MKTYIIAHFNSKIKYREYRFSTNKTKNLKPTDINAKRTDINIKPEDIQFYFKINSMLGACKFYFFVCIKNPLVDFIMKRRQFFVFRMFRKFEFKIPLIM